MRYTEVIDYTDWFISELNSMTREWKPYFGELYYDMIAAIEDGYTMEVE